MHWKQHVHRRPSYLLMHWTDIDMAQWMHEKAWEQVITGSALCCVWVQMSPWRSPGLLTAGCWMSSCRCGPPAMDRLTVTDVICVHAPINHHAQRWQAAKHGASTASIN